MKLILICFLCSFVFDVEKIMSEELKIHKAPEVKGFSISLLLDIFCFSLPLVKGLISLYKLMLLISCSNRDLTWIKPKLP